MGSRSGRRPSALDRDDVHGLLAALLAELHRARGQGEQRVVATTTDVHAGVEPCATLANDDLACVHHLAPEPLYAEALGVGVTPVAGAGRTLLVCHCCQLLLGLDVGYLDAGQLLPVTLPLVVAGLVLELVDPDLGTLGLLDDLAQHRHLGQLGRVGRDVVAVDDEQRGERELGPRLTVELLDLDDVADGDLVLLAAGLDDRVHGDGTLLLLGLETEGCACGRPRPRVGPPNGGPTYRVRARRNEGQTGVSHRAPPTRAA